MKTKFWNGGLFEQRVGLAVGRLPGGFQEVCGVRGAGVAQFARESSSLEAGGSHQP